MMSSTFYSLLADIFQKPTSLPQTPSGSNVLTTILTIVFTAAGLIAVLMITIGGLEYVISQGDPQRTAKAKNTILYAVIGLVVAISGFTIVTFVIGRLTP
jgi:hypothetical protein